MINGHRLAVLAGCLAFVFGCSTDRLSPPSVWDGLEYRPGPGSGALYVYPDAEVGAVGGFLVDPPVVVIDADWNPQISVTVGRGIAPDRLTDRDRRHIVDVIAREFRKIVVREIEAGGYRVVERAEADTTVVTTALVDLHMARASDDNMTFAMLVRDASTGAVLARFFDQQTGDMGFLQFPDSVTESDNFRRAARDWGRKVVSITETMAR